MDMPIRSILDNDTYKFSMQQAVLRMYPGVPVEYQFTDRSPAGRMDQKFHGELRAVIDNMSSLELTQEEARFLGRLPFISKEYVEYLRNYRFKPEQVTTKIEDGQLRLSIAGPWHETILWEVPLMAAISEVYFRQDENKDGWIYNKTIHHAYYETAEKGGRLEGLKFTDFGTRRRRSYEVQNSVIQALKGCRTFQGTSNVHFAHEYRLRPIGTQAHEWIMGISAIEGLNRANWHAMAKWKEVYKGQLGIALTDTFGTAAFWKEFDPELARLYDGVRHDSGDPFQFAEDAIEHYRKLGLDPLTKTIVFSDGLNVDKCLELSERFKDRIGMSFGIGTHFTNDFLNSPALKIVIKLRKCNGRHVVKFSDDLGKITGDLDAQRVAKYIIFGTPLDTER